MSVSELTDEQVVSLVKRLPPGRKRAALFALAEEARRRVDERLEYGEDHLRRLAGERGLKWDSLTDEEREIFVNDLLHAK